MWVRGQKTRVLKRRLPAWLPSAPACRPARQAIRARRDCHSRDPPTMAVRTHRRYGCATRPCKQLLSKHADQDSLQYERAAGCLARGTDTSGQHVRTEWRGCTGRKLAQCMREGLKGCRDERKNKAKQQGSVCHQVVSLGSRQCLANMPLQSTPGRATLPCTVHRV